MPYFFEEQKKVFRGNAIDHLTLCPHFHPHLEMIYLKEGSSAASVDGRTSIIEAGDLFIAFPNQIHCYYDRSKLNGNLVIFAPELIPDLQAIFEKRIPVDPVIKKECLPSDIGARMTRIVEKIQSQEPLPMLSARGELLMLMAEVVPNLHCVQTPVRHDSVKDVLLYCVENYTEPLTLDVIAKNLHLNKFYISHIFRERLKISFPDFINGLRVERACTMLSENCSITEVAFASGFSSIRTFNRAFVQRMGKSPTAYIRENSHEA